MLKSLLWKEWREQRWKLAFGCVLLGGGCLIALRARMLEDSASLAIALMVGMVLMTLIVSMGIVATDREQRNLPFQFGLPCSSALLFAVKITVGLIVSLFPLLCALALWALFAGSGLEHIELRSIMFLTCWWNLSTVIWTTAFGVRQPTEARVGMVGIGILGFWFCSWIFLQGILGRTNDFFLALFFNPLILLYDPDDLRLIQMQALLLCALLFWSFRRFKKLGGIPA